MLGGRDEDNSWIMNYDDGAHHVDLPPRTTPATLPTIVAPTIIEDTDTNTEEASETTPEQPEQ